MQLPSRFHGHPIAPPEGQTLAPAFAGDSIKHHTTFWEHEANIATRDGKWKLVASTPANKKFDPKRLRLYNLEEDPTKMNDLSEKYPERLQSMYNQWHAWGERVKVFPIDTRTYGMRKVIDQPLHISTAMSTGDFKSTNIPKNGNYRPALSFGDVTEDTQICIDNVILQPVASIVRPAKF